MTVVRWEDRPGMPAVGAVGLPRGLIAVGAQLAELWSHRIAQQVSEARAGLTGMYTKNTTFAAQSVTGFTGQLATNLPI